MPAVLLAALLCAAPAVRAGDAPAAAEQSAISDVTADVERRLVELLLAPDDPNPERALRLKRAVEYLRGHDVAEKTRRAAQLLSEGRLAESCGLQEEAEADLRRIIEILGQPRFQDSIRRLSEVRARLAALRAAEAKLAEAASREGAAADVRALADAQEPVRSDAAALARDMAEAIPPVPGAAGTRAAEAAMAQALAQLQQGRPGEAAHAQAEARDRLDEALAALDRALAALQAQAADEARRRIVEALSAVLAEQRSLTAATAALLSTPSAPGRQEIARKEAALGKKAEGVARELEEAGSDGPFRAGVVDVAARLAAVGRRMDAAPPDGEVAAGQRAIEASLQRLLDALNESPTAGQPPEAQKSPSDGAAPAPPAPPPLVPVAAELRLLKRGQEDLLADTVRTDSAPTKAEADTAALAARQAGLARSAQGLAPAVPPLADIAGQMARSQRELAAAKTGAENQKTQKDVIEGLEALLGQSSSTQPKPQPGQGGSQPSAPAAVSSASPRPGAYRPEEGGAKTGAWLTGLPPRERAVVETPFRTGDLPTRYKVLIEEYNRSLAEER